MAWTLFGVTLAALVWCWMRLLTVAADRDRYERRFKETEQALRDIEGETASAQGVTPGQTPWSELDSAGGQDLMNQGSVQILDVRTPEETKGGAIQGAVNVPLDQLEARVGELTTGDTPTLVYCAGGARSTEACQMLSKRGFTRLYNLTGGFTSWTGPRA